MFKRELYHKKLGKLGISQPFPNFANSRKDSGHKSFRLFSQFPRKKKDVRARAKKGALQEGNLQGPLNPMEPKTGKKVGKLGKTRSRPCCV